MRYLEKAALVLSCGLIAASSFASDVRFSAEVDQTQIPLDGSVSLKLTVTSDSGSSSDPEFNAPGFEVVSQFSSFSMSSQFDSSTNGFVTSRQQQITKVLHPLKTGTLKISDIQLKTEGKVLKAPDITIQVVQAGSTTQQGSRQMQPGFPPGRNLGPFGNRRGVIPRGDKAQAAGPNGFVKAELSKDQAYKGEQIIVSYYLYSRARIYNLQVDKFPVLDGFLREDLEIPVMSQRLNAERVEVNGVSYERYLLARYAAYPLQAGDLNIDSLSLKYNYYATERNSPFDQDDPFFSFFQQMTPRIASAESEKSTLKVLPLPEEGKPRDFDGGIGDFSVTSAVNKYDVRANEAVTLTVKVEGKGNVTTVKEPRGNWPAGIDLFDSKGKVQQGHGGVGEKVFEILLIPRSPGKVTLPGLRFSFFDPEKKIYYTKSTEPIQLNVLDPLPGSQPVVPAKSVPSQPESSPNSDSKYQANQMRGLKPPVVTSEGTVWQPASRILFWATCLALAFLAFLIGTDLKKKWSLRSHERRRKTGEAYSQEWKNLKNTAQSALQKESPWSEVTHAYEKLAEILLDSIDHAFQLRSRSLSRAQIGEILVAENGVSPEVWGKAVRLLEYVDLVRYASSLGAVSEQAVRSDLAQWVDQGEEVVQKLKKSGSS